MFRAQVAVTVKMGHIRILLAPAASNVPQGNFRPGLSAIPARHALAGSTSQEKATRVVKPARRGTTKMYTPTQIRRTQIAKLAPPLEPTTTKMKRARTGVTNARTLLPEPFPAILVAQIVSLFIHT